AAVISEQADELIDNLTSVINQKLTRTELDNYIMGYPTLASDLSYLLK
ncbi:NAD(P)/FAD-dependent oxidoreductase, partial [Enterococcus faecalis]